jgi:hypothetical protein
MVSIEHHRFRVTSAYISIKDINDLENKKRIEDNEKPIRAVIK